jgi:hypothetical protein
MQQTNNDNRRPLNGSDYLIRYDVPGSGGHIHETVIRAVDMRSAELIFKAMYQGCKMTSDPRALN